MHRCLVLEGLHYLAFGFCIALRVWACRIIPLHFSIGPLQQWAFFHPQFSIPFTP